MGDLDVNRVIDGFAPLLHLFEMTHLRGLHFGDGHQIAERLGEYGAFARFQLRRSPAMQLAFALRAFHGDAEPLDDTTIVILRRNAI
jgi:hypothetical protein